MEEIYDEVEKVEEVMLPGFRFHPTDEELVSFYLRRKVLQRPLSIELIKQLDIYKYDPWDLPKFAMTGEKEWYFYCPRDRKYRNSARPNRVTDAGFWKATGTDRPIYSSEGNKCIGLKKSLVFYRGRAAKGVKTDWMMHEFRLPCSPAANHSSSTSAPPKKFVHKPIPATDSWAICRIFKKTNSTAHRALSHSFVSSSVPETSTDKGTKVSNATQFGSDNNTQRTTSSGSSYSQFSHENVYTHQTSHVNTTTPLLSCLDFASYNHLNPINHHQLLASPPQHLDLANFLFAPSETQSHLPKHKPTVDDVSSLLQLNMPSRSFLGEYVNQADTLSSHMDFNGQLLQDLQCPDLVTLPQELQCNSINYEGEKGNILMKNLAEDQYWETVRSSGFPLGLSAIAADQQDLMQKLEFFFPPWQLEI